ncbi:MAG: glucose-1-phosphate cytidylyltransferase [Methanobrevibacter sp.]|jgi:glucose-1-phosphate cytidylyltransferase|nr:glucose-1-phosphate cytidylyltransferase [Candidatus Methanoflexus mossambicus]
MKVVILAGGLGTRLGELTDIKPKPMVELGGMPIIWHIMKIYSSYGFNDFIICLGYKGYIIKEFFANYYLYNSDVTIDFVNNNMDFYKSEVEPWNVSLINTGARSQTAQRIKKIEKYTDEDTFMLTYGDGLSNVNLNDLLDFHKKKGKYATLTAVQPEGKFGALNINNNNFITEFNEKPKGDNNWINGGFFVLENEIFDYIDDKDVPWEREPLESLAKDNHLSAFKHHGFWKPMDMLKDKKELEKMWNSGNAKWKIWDD